MNPLTMEVSVEPTPTLKSSPYTVGLFPNKQFVSDFSNGIP